MTKGRMHKMFKPSAAAHRPSATYATGKGVRYDRSAIAPAPLAQNRNVEKWIVVYTAPNSEDEATRELRMAGYQVYCPRMTKWGRVGRWMKRKHAALFPRYLFVGVTGSESKGVTSCRGVSASLTDASGWRSVPWHVVAEISDRQANGLFDETRNLSPDGSPVASALYKPGDFVRFKSGPFTDLIGTVIKAGDDERVSVLMAILNSHCEAKATVDMVEALA